MAGLVPVEAVATGLGDFETIVREHQSMVFSIAYRFLHDRELAEELAQDVFLQLHKNLSALKSPAHVTFWLHKVTGHRCIDYSRHRKPGREVNLERTTEMASEAPMSDPMLASRLRKLVASLPPKSRMVVILRYEEELELAEIARVLGMPLGTVKSHLQRALATLREKAGRWLGEVNL
jgi:RNA polymerase sigma-70 factor (ECF subfamily)